jgi:GntR family transcriptional regulator / MocR family aminotransferase
LDGILTAGARLPSPRSLADHLNVSRATTLLAYEQLAAEGYVTPRHGSGTFVARDLPDDLPRRLRFPRPSRTRHPQLSRRGATLIAIPGRDMSGPSRPFRLGTPALDLFPFHQWTRLVDRRLRSMTIAQLDYGDAAGLGALREAIAELVETTRGTRCSADQVFIVAGSQRALQALATVLLDPGDTVWLEEPGYPGGRSAFVAAGARIVPINVDNHGLDVAAAVRRERNARMAYVTPSSQFPMGVPMSLPRRLALLKWASTAGAWIVEDDYDSEFRYGTRPFPCLHGLDPDGRVLYVGTFAKSMFPALRLGFLIVPTDLHDKFRAFRRASEVHPPSLEQMVLADFIAGGHYARHVRRMRAVYRERAEMLADAVEQLCGDALRLRKIQTGLHAVADLSGVGAHQVCDEARKREVEVAPLSRFFAGHPTIEGLVLGFASTPTDMIRRGVEKLAASIESARRLKPPTWPADTCRE